MKKLILLALIACGSMNASAQDSERILNTKEREALECKLNIIDQKASDLLLKESRARRSAENMVPGPGPQRAKAIAEALHFTQQSIEVESMALAIIKNPMRGLESFSIRFPGIFDSCN